MLDPNVLISALLSPSGGAAALLIRWLSGEFELIVSAKLLAELHRALAYPKLRARVTEEEATAFVELLGRSATSIDDPAGPARRSREPGDDYLLALAEASGAALVTGDQDILALAHLPVLSPAEFLRRLA